MSETLSICPIGNSNAITTTTTLATANVVTGTNTFRISNASSSVYAYAGIFKTYAAAQAAAHPVAGTPNSLVLIAPNESVNLVGNFGINPNPGTVYVSTITATGSTTVFATPLAP